MCIRDSISTFRAAPRQRGPRVFCFENRKTPVCHCFVGSGLDPVSYTHLEASSKFSSRYSSGNPRCTACICTTVISWVSCPRNSNRVSTARNWSASGKIPRKFLQNTLLFTTTSSRLYRQSWTCLLYTSRCV